MFQLKDTCYSYISTLVKLCILTHLRNDGKLHVLIKGIVLIEQRELIQLRELSRFHEVEGHSFGGRERHDSTDSIEDSIETKRLRSEITKLQAECEHWKSVAHGAVSWKHFYPDPLSILLKLTSFLKFHFGNKCVLVRIWSKSYMVHLQG